MREIFSDLVYETVPTRTGWLVRIKCIPLKEEKEVTLGEPPLSFPGDSIEQILSRLSRFFRDKIKEQARIASGGAP